MTCSADGAVLPGFPVTVEVTPGTPTRGGHPRRRQMQRGRNRHRSRDRGHLRPGGEKRFRRLRAGAHHRRRADDHNHQHLHRRRAGHRAVQEQSHPGCHRRTHHEATVVGTRTAAIRRRTNHHGRMAAATRSAQPVTVTATGRTCGQGTRRLAPVRTSLGPTVRCRGCRRTAGPFLASAPLPDTHPDRDRTGECWPGCPCPIGCRGGDRWCDGRAEAGAIDAVA